MLVTRRSIVAAAIVSPFLAKRALAQCASGFTLQSNVFVCQQNPGTINFGSSVIPAGFAAQFSGGAWGTEYTCPINGTVQSMSVYMSQQTGACALAIYAMDGAGGVPGSLLGNTPSFAPGSAWNTVPIASGPSLNVGVNYFLAFCVTGGTPVIQQDDTNAVGRSWFATDFTITSVRNPFPAVTVDNATWPIYATLQ